MRKNLHGRILKWKLKKQYISIVPKSYPLQIIPLKFGDVWILHPKISDFGFNTLKFESVLILHPNVS